MRVLTDVDVRGASATVVVAAAREALEAFAGGRLHAPPRVPSELGATRYVFTVGALSGVASGFRVYRAGAAPGDQLVAVWDDGGTLVGVVVGDELGARRTGALGAVAADELARADADCVAVVGSGRQAWAQLWALTAVRSARDVRIYSPSERHRDDFADRARDELQLSARPVGTAAEAVGGADIVLIATSSMDPVIAVDSISPGTHVTTVGPKSRQGHEIPTELADAASVVTCDSPGQARSYSEPFFTDPAGLISLADIVVGRSPGRRAASDITLHCSVGLAGTEVVLAERLFHALP